MNLTYLSKAILLFIVILIVATRIYVGINHFAHYDDLYAPYILKLIWSYDNNKLTEQLIKYGVPGIYSGYLESIIANDMLGGLIRYIIGPIAVAKTSTYAPLQFYISNLFVNFDIDYPYSIFAARLPSILLSLLYFFLLYKLLLIIRPKIKIYEINIFFLVPAVSWMFLIYSAQSESYAIALVFVLIWLLEIENYKQGCSGSINIKRLCFWLLLGTLSSYQLIFFLPAFFVTMLFVAIKKNKNYSGLIKNLFILVFVSVISFMVPYLLFIRGRLKSDPNPGLGWNAGPENQYIFEAHDSGDIVAFFGFLIHNVNDIVIGLFGFAELSPHAAGVFAFGFVFFVIFGLVYLFKAVKTREILIFSLFSLVTWFLFIFAGKLAFSPTRHSLIYIAPISIFFCFGLIFVIEEISDRLLINKELLSGFFVLCVLLFFLGYFKENMQQRENKFVKHAVLDIIKNNPGVDVVAYGHDVNLEFMPYMKEHFDTRFFNQSPFFTVFYSKESRQKNSMIVLCSAQKICNEDGVVDSIIKIYSGNNSIVRDVYSLSVESKTTNCFGNFAGHGANGIVLKLINFGF